MGKSIDRRNEMGFAGRPQSANNQGKSDPRVKQFSIPVSVVASTAEQDTGVTMPVKASEVNVCVNILTPEVTGLTKTINVGFTGDSDALIAGADVSAAGMKGATGGVGELQKPVDLSATNITYALGSADFAELGAEIIVTVIAAAE